MKTAGVLLAAGASRRFGTENKLLAPLAGVPLVQHAAEALAAARPDALIAVTSDAAVAAVLPRFMGVSLDGESPEQSDSLRAGISHARAIGADRAVVVLGDMPFVTADLISAVIARSTSDQPSAATDGIRPMPPACFPGASFAALETQTGDRGAAALLRALPPFALVTADAAVLTDIDTPAALAAARGV